MVYDVTMLEAFYAAYKGKVEHVRAVLKRPLTLAEKILYAHLYDVADVKDYKRGEDYVNFRPDRVAMQDATAQMALLQFMNAGKDRVAVPSTVHCDHLIQAYKGAKEDIATARMTNEEVYDFLRDVSSRYDIGFWKPGAGIIHQVVLDFCLLFPAGLGRANGYFFVDLHGVPGDDLPVQFLGDFDSQAGLAHGGRPDYGHYFLHKILLQFSLLSS